MTKMRIETAAHARRSLQTRCAPSSKFLMTKMRKCRQRSLMPVSSAEILFGETLARIRATSFALVFFAHTTTTLLERKDRVHRFRHRPLSFVVALFFILFSLLTYMASCLHKRKWRDERNGLPARCWKPAFLAQTTVTGERTCCRSEFQNVLSCCATASVAWNRFNTPFCSTHGRLAV